MSATLLSVDDVRQFLFAEAARSMTRMDAWLGFYAPDVEFWMPSWSDDDKLITDRRARFR